MIVEYETTYRNLLISLVAQKNFVSLSPIFSSSFQCHALQISNVSFSQCWIKHNLG
jgi:hypothetical protein